MSGNFAHNETTELLWKARVYQNEKGEERTTWETWTAVYDTESEDEHGWFAIVRYVWRDGYRRLFCEACDDEDCKHVRRMVSEKQEARIDGERAGVNSVRSFDANVFTE